MEKVLKKIILSITFFVVIIVLVLSSINIRWTADALIKEVEDKIFFETSQYANEISMIFMNAEGAVDAIANTVTYTYNLVNHQNDYNYIHAYKKMIAPIIESSLQDVKDASGLFVTFAPELTDYIGTHEIWYTYNDAGEVSFTDANANGVYLEAFFQPEAPNMQYYFQATTHNGEGVWIDPNYDPDIDDEVITYAKSIWSENILIGVAGVDLLTDHTIDIIKSMDIKYNGIIVLFNRDYDLLLTVSKNNGPTDSDIQQSWNCLRKIMQDKEKATFHSSVQNRNYFISCCELSNDWTLAIINDEKVIYDAIHKTKETITMLAIVLCVLAMAFVGFAVNKFASPAKKAEQMLRIMNLDNNLSDEEKLSIHNADIESLVQRQMERQRNHDIAFAHRGRLEQAGGIMETIAHQWKQPLNKINILLGNLLDEYDFGEMTKDSLTKAINRSEEIIKGMSKTIDDFREYMRPDTNQSSFFINEPIHAVLNLLEDSFKLKNIEITLITNDAFVGYGSKSAFYHIMLNILTNAIDAIEDSRSSGNIEIAISENIPTNTLVIDVVNDGNHIEEEDFEFLFKPYFTTRTGRNGTGLGLVISKDLVVKAMNGTITLQNHLRGVKCTIIIERGTIHE